MNSSHDFPETQAKRAQEMERFKIDTKDDALLDDLNDELEGMMLDDTND